MKVLFWVPYPTEGPSNRYRVEQYLPYLSREGIEYSLHSFWNKSVYKYLYRKGIYARKIFYFIIGLARRIFDLIRMDSFDIVFIHRESWPLGFIIFEKIILFRKKPIIFDFDDAIFLTNVSKANNFIERFKNPQKIFKIISLSNHVIAGNRYLADFALKFNKNVTIVPSAIDTENCFPKKDVKQFKHELVVGWIGSVTTAEFLKPMDNVFKKLSEKYKYLTFKIVGTDFYGENLNNLIFKRWSLNEEQADLQNFDIGIMPMPDNAWTRGKCGFKAILYMAVGIPVVCSPVGVNREIINDGINGFFAETDNGWIEKLSLLIEDAGLRNKIGLAGRKTIEEKYSIKVNAPKFIGIIHKAYKDMHGR